MSMCRTIRYSRRKRKKIRFGDGEKGMEEKIKCERMHCVVPVSFCGQQEVHCKKCPQLPDGVKVVEVGCSWKSPSRKALSSYHFEHRAASISKEDLVHLNSGVNCWGDSWIR